MSLSSRMNEASSAFWAACVWHIRFHVFQLGYLRINILTRLVVIRSLIYYCHMTVFGSVLMENVWAVPNESCGWTLKAIKNPSLRVGHRNWSCTIWLFFFFLQLHGCFRTFSLNEQLLFTFKSALWTNVIQIKWWCEIHWHCSPNQPSPHLISDVVIACLLFPKLCHDDEKK